ncbi:rpn-1 [Pristionchus pacificus]|uniref:26S proteasome non-ATPase regulatory subunit 2 n=1 Tax=Pristionchus pacificus TaxID=54126 RepID=A0A2A6CAQ7_PRIPA|nr:rpn-1 [Pristionchus pacificus]|eukprot:PDM75207.1 rpn-1 [Pristionchus pacificus]
MVADAAKKDKPEEKKGKNAKDEKKDEMSDEDKKLEEDLNMLVKRLGEPDTSLYKPSLESMRTLIRASTTSMTSVPKPLKFMRPHYTTMKHIHEKIADPAIQKECANLISVLAMTSDEPIDCIIYRLKGTQEPVGDWGHEYVRHLAMELSEEWKKTADGTEAHKKTREQLLILARDIVVHHMKHNAEVEACDLLIEIERLDLLISFVDEADHQRVCLYLLSCAPLTPDPDNIILIRTAKDLHLKFNKYLEAVRCAIMLNDTDEIKRIFKLTTDSLLQMQMAILLGRHQIFLDFEGAENGEKLGALNANTSLFEYFHSLGRELDIMEPKTPEGIYKSHLEASRPFGSTSAPDSARMNLAAAFVNGFVNCGFGVDKMMAEQEDANRWFYKNKEYGMFSAAASQGLVWRWDIDSGLAQCDRFLYVNDDFIKAGTLLAIGIISSGIQDPCDPASAILLDHVHSDRSVMRVGSVFGLGLAYANSKRETVIKKEEGGVIHELRKVITDTRTPSPITAEVRGLAALSLGLILVGTADHDVANEMVTSLMEKSEIELADPNMRFYALGVALIFLGTQEKAEVTVELVKCIAEPFGSMFATLVDVCAYAGTGNVLKIQGLLHLCSEHYETKEDKKSKHKDDPKSISKTKSSEVSVSTTSSASVSATSTPTTTPAKRSKKEATKAEKTGGKVDLSSQQAVAVLGIGLIAMGDEVGSQMALRMFGHLIRYGEAVIRRAVPLAMALLSVSNPQLNILETLSKFSHDADPSTAHSSIFALGLVGAGTNNARLVAMLRQLASFHHKDQMSLMLVRLSQGLTHLAKGTMTLNPWHSDRQMLCPSALAGILTVCYAFLDANNSIMNNKQHYLLYSLVLAMQPRMLTTLVEDEKKQLKQVNVTVRVGQAVDVVAQAGRPKTITGFQTHKTPVLLAYGERAELASEEYLSMTPYLEGLVILKKNPNYEAPLVSKPKA